MLCLSPPTHVLMIVPPHIYVITISSSAQSCKTIPPLSNSDRLGLQLHSQWKQASQPQCHSGKITWRYAHADWQRANDLIMETDWQSLITGDMDTSSGTIGRIDFLKS